MLFYLWGRLGVFWNRLLGRPRVVVWLFCGCSKVVLGLPPSTFLPAAYSFEPPSSSPQTPASSLQLPPSNIQPPASDLQAAASTLQLESLWVGSGVILGVFWACSGVRLGFVGVALGLFSACSRRCLGLL